MTVKEYFQQAFTIDRLLKATRTQLEELREKRLIVSSLSYGEKVQNSPNSEKFNASSDLFIDLEQTLVENEKRLTGLKFEFLGHIHKLDKPTHQLIMMERYVNLKKWDQICIDNNYSWGAVHKIHGEALKCMEVYIGNMI